MEPTSTVEALERQPLEIAEYVEYFAAQFIGSNPSKPESVEIARRNLLVSVMEQAYALSDGQGVRNEDYNAVLNRNITPVSGNIHYKRWEVRKTMLFSALTSKPMVRVTSGLEILESLKVGDGRFWHDLSVFVP